MVKRYLDCSASELMRFSADEVLESIARSEGRIIVSEVIGATQPLLMNITNAELAASQGADLLLLNMFDVKNPLINGMPENIDKSHSISVLQKLTGRVIGVNLEAVDKDFKPQQDHFWRVKSGRLANAENAKRLIEMGAGFIVITGNPENGVSNQAIFESLQTIREAVGRRCLLIAGKMHASGIAAESGEKMISQSVIDKFLMAGADIILLPAPGTVPGVTQDYIKALIDHIHRQKALAMTAIGTSQEGAADLHHIGDTGYCGIALPENIKTYSVAIRGVRHTYARMARSINR
ncbi:MAG: hypothetical protein ACO2ZM_03440 [Francisellaceae bacterium]